MASLPLTYEEDAFLRQLGHLTEIFQTGSQAICPESATGESDYDYVVYANGPALTFLAEAELTTNPNYDAGVAHLVFRKGRLNFIYVDEALADRWRLATQVATRLRLCKRADRVLVFRAIIAGELHVV